MVYPVSSGLHVAIKHGAGAAPSHLMPGAMHIQVFFRGFFPHRNRRPHLFAEDLGAPAGQGVEPGCLQLG